MDWKTGKDKFGNNILTQTMEKIEKKLEQAGAHFPDTPEGRLVKYEAIAMVLSGKALHEGSTDSRWPIVSKFGWKKGSVVSLYGNDFTEYRKEFDENTEQASCSPKETDPDYFNARNGGSDVMLLNRTMIGIILEKTSTGTWTFKTQAEGFMAQTFDRHEELGKINPEAQKHLEEEMRKKISSWWNGTDDSRKQQFFSNKDQLNRPMWEELLKRNLLDRHARNNLKNIIKKFYTDLIPDSNPKKDEEIKRVKDLFTQAEALAAARSDGD